MLNTTIMALLIINSTITGIGNISLNVTNGDDINLSMNDTGITQITMHEAVNGSYDDMLPVLPTSYHSTIKAPL